MNFFIIRNDWFDKIYPSHEEAIAAAFDFYRISKKKEPIYIGLLNGEFYEHISLVADTGLGKPGLFALDNNMKG